MVHLYMISSLLGYPGQDVLRPKSRERRPCTVILCVLRYIHIYVSDLATTTTTIDSDIKDPLQHIQLGIWEV